MTATADRNVTVKDLLAPKLAPIDLDLHRADLARRQEEMDARREEMLRCCNPQYAASKEMQKKVWEWTVTAEWYGAGDDGPGVWGPETIKVKAQNEADAWAMFCDRIQQWPSPRDAKRTIKRGKQVSSEDVIAAAVAGSEADAELPRYKITPKRKAKKS
jgi:hypothetical protein